MPRIRLIIVRLIFLLIAVAAVDRLVFLGLLRQVRVESGSMAETVRGLHYRVTCGECGYEFACDATKPPASGRATCPLCGNANNKLDETIYPGERLWVDRTAFWWRSPRRWEPIVFRDPGSGQLTIKRVVGLPGEKISIRTGDVYADGRLLDKPDDVRRAMGILVSDSKYQKGDAETSESTPPLRGGNPRRSRGVLSTSIAGSAWEQGDALIRVLDNYGYNQTESRRLNEVRKTWTVKDGSREQVFRDVYYTDVPRPGTGLPPDKYELGPDEYFVLGDNSPISDDSRHWPHPGLPAAAIVGKPLGVR